MKNIASSFLLVNNSLLYLSSKKLPPKGLTRLDHFAYILLGKKRLLDFSEMNTMEITRYNKFKTEFILQQCLDDKECKMYLP